MSRVEQARVLGHHAAVTQERLPRNGLQVVRLARGTSARAAAVALEREAGVVYAEPNFVYHLDALPDDPFFGDLWGMTAIQAPAAWDTTTGSPNVRVAVVDTGIAYDHPDLAPNVWTNPGESGGGKETNGLDDDGDGFVDDVHGWDFLQGDNQPLDFSGHGTHVAGTIGAAGNNGTGVAGVDWQTSLMALRAGNTELEDADIISAFAYACAHGAKVVNASFGGPGFSQAMLDTITSPGCANTLFVAAAGNDGVDVDTAPSYPCSFAAPNLVCVAATDTDGTTLAGFSNYGPGSVDIAAPGVDVLSTVPSFQSVFEDDFESSIATSWTVGGTTPHWARQADGAGGFVLSDSAAGDYAANADNWARPTSAVDLTGKQGCAVQYDLTLDTQQDHDFLLVEGSSDLTNWTTLDTHSGSVDDFFLDDLSAFDGSPTFYLRFRLTSDADGTVGDGALVDNVVLTCLGTTFSSSDYFQLSGTSMAAPHVAGVAALIWSAVPSASVAEVKAELMQGATQLTSLSGKVASGGFLNAAGAISDATSPLPDTTLLQAPPHLTRSRATSFTFGGGSAGFEWSLDGGAWTPTLLSTLNLSVGEGSHTLFVRARDVLTRVDPTPASWTWEVDETPPVANILSPRAGQTFHTSTVSDRLCHRSGRNAGLHDRRPEWKELQTVLLANRLSRPGQPGAYVPGSCHRRGRQRGLRNRDLEGRHGSLRSAERDAKGPRQGEEGHWPRPLPGGTYRPGLRAYAGGSRDRPEAAAEDAASEGLRGAPRRQPRPAAAALGSTASGTSSASDRSTTSAWASASSAGGKCSFGIASTRIPAAFAARMPFSESSIAAA